MAQKSRNRRRLWALAVLSGLWLLFVLYLDIKYEKFPDVLLGGIKILLFCYMVLLLLWLAMQLSRRIVATMRRAIGNE